MDITGLNVIGDITASGTITASGYLGTASYATSASNSRGGFKSYALNPADMPPASPSIWDDEFDTANESAPDYTKWIWANKLSASAAIQSGKLVLSAPPMTADKHMLFIQPTGSMGSNWTFTAKISPAFPGFDSFGAGVIVYSTGSGKFIYHGIIIAAATSRHQRSKYTNVTTFSGTTSYIHTYVGMVPAYFKIYRSGSGTSADTLFWYTSADGISWAQDGPSETVATFMGDISHIGFNLAVVNALYSGSYSVDWARGNWTASWDPTINY